MNSTNRIPYEYFNLDTINAADCLEKNNDNSLVNLFHFNDNEYNCDENKYSENKSYQSLVKIDRFINRFFAIYLKLIRENLLFGIINFFGMFIFILILYVLLIRK